MCTKRTRHVGAASEFTASTNYLPTGLYIHLWSKPHVLPSTTNHNILQNPNPRLTTLSLSVSLSLKPLPAVGRKHITLRRQWRRNPSVSHSLSSLQHQLNKRKRASSLQNPTSAFRNLSNTLRSVQNSRRRQPSR